MRVLLDTQVFILLTGTPEVLNTVPRPVRQLLLDSQTERCLSVISLTEIAIKHGLGKASLPRPALHQAIDDLSLTLHPYTAQQALGLYDLPVFADHRDPFDRQLIAVALTERIPLVGSDRQFARYEGLQVIW